MTTAFELFQDTLKFWKAVKVSELQELLDTSADDIASRQEASISSRKCLIDFSRNFMGQLPEPIKPLIKRFQKEVDLLETRSQMAEMVFLKVCQRLASVVDPCVALEMALERESIIVKAQKDVLEAKELRQSINNYKTEIQALKAQEKRANNLQIKLDTYDKNIDAQLEARITNVTAHLVEEHEEKMRLILLEKESLENRLAEMKDRLQTARREIEQNQNRSFDAELERQEKRSALDREIEMLMNDLEAANQRAICAEGQLQMLQEQVSSNSDDNEISVDEQVLVGEVDNLLRLKEAELTKINREMQASKDKETNLVKQIDQMRIESECLKLKLEEANKVLSDQSDYATIKRDLGILKMLEFSSSQKELPANVSSAEGDDSLEVSILRRSKFLQSEVASLRVENKNLKDKLETTTANLASNDASLQKKTVLIAQLEQHLEALRSSSGQVDGKTGNLLGGSTHLELVPIIEAQRDRLQERNDRLELQCTDFGYRLKQYETDIENLRADNVQLYEKIRYLHSFGKSGHASADGESSYRTSYEQRLDPFSRFTSSERMKRYSQLSVVEKLLLAMVQFAMSNKTGRVLVFAYFMFLHILVFLVLMYVVNWNSHYRDVVAAEWQNKYVEHMDEFHAN